MEKKGIAFGVLLITLLTYSIYVTLPGKVRIDVQPTKTELSVFIDGGWQLGATEYVYLYDGAVKMRASNRQVINYTENNLIKIARIADWKDGIHTIHTYVFDSTVDNVENIPIEETFLCMNCEGKIVHFEYREIGYHGQTREAISPELFDRNTKIEWEDGYDWAKVYQQKVASDKLVIRYRPTSDFEIYHVRLFDPTPAPTLQVYTPQNGTTYVYGTNNSINVSYLSTHTLNRTYTIKILANNSALFTNTSYINATNSSTIVDVSIGSWNLTIFANDTNASDGHINTSTLYLTIFPSKDIRVEKYSIINHTDLKNIFSPNISKISDQLNFSNAAVFAGNFSWNFSQTNVSNNGTYDYVYNISNNGSLWNVSVVMKINATKPWFELRCTNRYLYIGTAYVELFNLTPGSSQTFNCTLNLINISQSYSNWSLTKNNATWDFNETINIT